MKLFGSALLLLAAVVIVYAYRMYLRRADEEAEGYLDFLRHIRAKMHACPSSYKDMCLCYDNEILSNIGFLEGIRKGNSLEEAFVLARESSVLQEGINRLLSEYFSSAGKGGLDFEIKSLEHCINELSQMCEKQKEENSKRARLIAAVVTSGALGAIILLL